MTDLSALREKRKVYIKNQADKIVRGMVRRNVTIDSMATCDASNWDKELHNAMPEIVTELEKQGIRTTSTVNWGVTDWTFTVKV